MVREKYIDPVHITKVYRRSSGMAAFSLNIGTRGRGVLSPVPCALAALRPLVPVE